MKLYDVPRDTRIRMRDGFELNFHHIDGMYSYCTMDSGVPVHLEAWCEVEIVEKKDECKTGVLGLAEHAQN